MDLEKRIKLIVEDLKRYKPKKVILFGSGASGKFFDEYSDIDLLVIKDKVKKNFISRLGEVAEFVRPQLWPLDILVYTSKEIEKLEKESAFIKKILKEGKTIYEKN